MNVTKAGKPGPWLGNTFPIFSVGQHGELGKGPRELDAGHSCHSTPSHEAVLFTEP